MTDLSEPSGRSFNDLVWRPIRARWWLLLALPLLLVALTLVWQAVRQPQYTATLVVAPNDENAAGVSSQLRGLSGLASVAGISLPKGQEVSAFDKFQFLLVSDRLGLHQSERRDSLQRAFAKRWDAANGRWIRPDGAVQAIKDALWPTFGMEAWLPPDGRDLAEHYADRLQQKKLGDTGLLQLSLDDPNPENARVLLSTAVADANELLRQDAAREAQRKAGYLRLQMMSAQIAEYRVNLSQLLAREEQTLMLTRSSTPYAAVPLQQVSVSRQPTSQRPVLFALIAGVIGLSLGVLIAVLLGDRRRATGLPRGDGDEGATEGLA